MLITKELKIRIQGNVKDYYLKNKINITPNEINKLPIELVNPNSHMLVEAKCDVCGKEVKIQYRRYNKSIDNGGYYSCSSKCSSEKRKKYFMLKYGVETPFESEEFKVKSKQTMLEKWGETHFRKSDEWKNGKGKFEKNKRDKTIFDIFLRENPKVVGKDYENFLIKCDIHGECTIPRSIYSNRKFSNTELCTKCNPIDKNISGKEILLYKMIKEFYDGEIIQSHKIGNKEIDIYLPLINIGFEFNGLRWHSELFLNDDYHIKKTLLCKDNGIRLVHIFEDDFDYRFEIVKSIIRNLLGKSKKIFARKTQIKLITDNLIVKDFLDENHLQGSINSNINYGLYFDGELISIMTFMKVRKIFGKKSSGNEYELIRFCNKVGYSVVGGASKLLKRFEEDYLPSSIVSYCDISWANGDLYKNLGFVCDGTTPPNYYYVINKVRESRIKYQKHKLVKQGFNSDLTEREIMNQRGYYRIYNCGNERYVKKTDIR